MDLAQESRPSREPVPVGALGKAAKRELTPREYVALAIAIVVGLMVVQPVMAIPITSVSSGVLHSVLGVVVIAFASLIAVALPPFLLPAPSRAGVAVMSWVGAQAFRRAFGSVRPAFIFPVVPAKARSWLTAHHPTERSLGVFGEAHVLVEDYAGAREIADRMPTRTPLERFEAADLRAMTDYQEFGRNDLSELRVALEAIPPGIHRVFAAAMPAVTEARRELPEGDWRAPLLRVRPQLPGSDAGILLRDHVLPIYSNLLMKIAPFALILIVLPVVLMLILATLLGRGILF